MPTVPKPSTNGHAANGHAPSALANNLAKRRLPIGQPKPDAADFLTLFAWFGVELQRNGAEGVGDCPWCEKANHFYVNAETGQFDCKRCGESGNAYTFTRRMYADALGKTTDADYQRLKRLRRGIPLQTLKRHGLAWDGANGCWLVPFKSAKGEVVNLCRYVEATGKKYMLPKLPLHLYGLDELSTDAGRILFLCEGPFDLIALDYQLRENKSRQRYDLLAVPGANVFKPEWASHLENRQVRLVYDNDDAGRQGQQRTVKVCQEAKASCRLSVLAWPEGTPEKFDVADLVRDKVNVVEFSRKHCAKIEAAQRLFFVRGDEVKSERKTWLWPGRIPCGSAVSFEGDQGTFKSTIARYLCAQVTIGGTMPDGSPLGIPAGPVLYFTAEDSAATVRDIVRLHGGNLERLFVHELELPDGDLLDILTVLPEIESQARLTGAKLVVVDPINAFIADYDVATDVKARRHVTGPLHNFAKRTGVCLLFLRNWAKGAEGSSTQRALGPSSMSHVCRCCMNTAVVEVGPPFYGKLIWSKVNDARHPKPIPFSAQDESNGVEDHSHYRRILWGKSPDPQRVKKALQNARKNRSGKR